MTEQATPPVETADADTRQKAQAIGWTPPERYRGDPEKFIDAETFLKRGTELMPILQANNRKLVDDNLRLTRKVDELTDTVKAVNESIVELNKFHTEDTRRKVQEERSNILAKLKEAKKEGDVDAEVDLTSSLSKLDKALDADTRAADKKEAAPVAKSNDPGPHPDFESWSAENPWFGKDRRRTRQAMDIAQELRADGSRLEGRAFFDKCAEVAAEEFGWETAAAPASKYSGGRPSGGAAGSKRGKGYDDLPSDAKAACDSYEAKIVRKGSPYPDRKAWRDYYVKEFFSEQ